MNTHTLHCDFDEQSLPTRMQDYDKRVPFEESRLRSPCTVRGRNLVLRKVDSARFGRGKEWAIGGENGDDVHICSGSALRWRLVSMEMRILLLSEA